MISEQAAPELRTYFTTAEIIQEHRARGHHFFDKSAMRFFRSRVAPGVIAGRYFITSEQFSAGSTRLYTVRFLNAYGGTENASSFQEFSSLKQARAAAKRYAKEDLSDQQARRLAFDWHSGGGSPLYQLASTGAINSPDAQMFTAGEIARTAAHAPDVYQPELAALLRYVQQHGTRPPVKGWSAL